jgi:hypothetical protein
MERACHQSIVLSGVSHAPVQTHGTSFELSHIDGAFSPPAACQRTPETQRVCGAPPEPFADGIT